MTPCWARYLFILVVVSLGTLSAIGACGRKGPLYLPQETITERREGPSKAPQATETPAAQPIPGPSKP